MSRQVETAPNDIQYVLTRADIQEIEAAMAHARKVGKPTISLSASDFPLERLPQRLESLRVSYLTPCSSHHDTTAQCYVRFITRITFAR